MMMSSISEQLVEEAHRRRGYRPLTLNDRQRRLMESRGIQRVQPRAEGAAPIRLHHTINGIPEDVLFALEALASLAEQGNDVARFVYEHELESLGITRPRIFIR